MRSIYNREDIIPGRKRSFNWKLYSFFTVISLLILFVVTFIVYRSLIFPYQVVTDSMEPGLKKGAMIWMVRHPDVSGLSRGDVVQVRSPLPQAEGEQPHVYLVRVVAVPGETVELDRKRVLVNGQPLVGQYKVRFTDPNRYFQPISARRDSMAPLKLQAGQVFVMGDNRDQSYDSRQFGPVTAKDILAKHW